MGEILPDGSIQGYTGRCEKCGKSISVNMQGNSLENHECVQPMPGKSASGETVEDAADIYANEFEDGRSSFVGYRAFIKGAQWQQSLSLQGVIEVIENGVRDYYNSLHSWEEANPLNLITDLLTQIKNLK